MTSLMIGMRRRGGFDIEIIATGDEILFGRIVDTNSSWIARRAWEAGAHLRRITCIGDDVDDIAEALREALSRGVELIVFTGGLGPTEDDVTIQAIGKAVGRGVELNPEAVELIREKCAALGVESTPRRERMARLLEGSELVKNPIGMSAGMMLREKGTTIVTLPGVPEEMKAMFDGYIAPMIAENATSRFLAKTVRVRMVWKDFFPVYRSVQDDFRDVYVKMAATAPFNTEEREKVRDIKVDLVVEGASKAECEQRMEAFLSDFKKRIEASSGILTTEKS